MRIVRAIHKNVLRHDIIEERCENFKPSFLRPSPNIILLPAGISSRETDGTKRVISQSMQTKHAPGKPVPEDALLIPQYRRKGASGGKTNDVRKAASTHSSAQGQTCVTRYSLKESLRPISNGRRRPRSEWKDHISRKHLKSFNL